MGGLAAVSPSAPTLAFSPGDDWPPRRLTGGPLFDWVVQETGLSEVLARSTVENLCHRLRINPQGLRVGDLPRLFEPLEKALRLFLDADQARARMVVLTGDAAR